MIIQRMINLKGRNFTTASNFYKYKKKQDKYCIDKTATFHDHYIAMTNKCEEI